MVVKEPQGEDSGGSEVKRVEFKVMSPLLTSLSVVFDKMINSEEFVERQKARWSSQTSPVERWKSSLVFFTPGW